jgi:dihydrofolate reductase
LPGRPPTSSLAPYRRPPLAGHAEGGVLLATSAVDGSARLVTGDAVTEITRLKTEDGGPMDVAGATLAAAAMRAGLIDECAIVTHPVLVGGGTPFFTALDNWGTLSLVETRTFPDDVVLTRYETRR